MYQDILHSANLPKFYILLLIFKNTIKIILYKLSFTKIIENHPKLRSVRNFNFLIIHNFSNANKFYI